MIIKLYNVLLRVEIAKLLMKRLKGIDGGKVFSIKLAKEYSNKMEEEIIAFMKEHDTEEEESGEAVIRYVRNKTFTKFVYDNKIAGVRFIEAEDPKDEPEPKEKVKNGNQTR